ncbi:response regulator [Hephaestia mangrovi]|uniref:response regulator n=1 Tax=Hephaestia mangrovi TaxID=2873268 RepID=UPI001CA76215|nr:response regulator [Hephaestia mangrovi]MBY8827688.1 response regulator [Hephaestia mangrovi]
MLFGRRPRQINRVLIVEDEPLIAFDTEHFLSEEGFEIHATVDRVAQAIEHIETSGESIDLVLVDVQLADGSGIEVAEAAHRHGVAALFVTGDCPSEAKHVAAGCLAKPYQQRDLLGAIRAIDDVLQARKVRKLPAAFTLFAEPAVRT